jgi:hypothetical protein
VMTPLLRSATLSFAGMLLSILAFLPAGVAPAARGATLLHHPAQRGTGGTGCAEFRFSARVNHRRWRLIVTDISVPAQDVTCTHAKRTIKMMIRSHSVPRLQCEAGRPTWDAEGHSYWSGWCRYPDDKKMTWQVEEYQLGGGAAT